MSDDPDYLAFEIAVSHRDPTWQHEFSDMDEVVRRAAFAALAAVDTDHLPKGSEVSIVLADDAAQRDLNRQYRDRDVATNVLSFANYDDGMPNGITPVLLGDIVLAREIVIKEAMSRNLSMADHVSHLIVHGILHLFGFDHIDDAGAEEMERLEISILAGLGISDPYRTVPADDDAVSLLQER